MNKLAIQVLTIFNRFITGGNLIVCEDDIGIFQAKSRGAGIMEKAAYRIDHSQFPYIKVNHITRFNTISFSLQS